MQRVLAEVVGRSVKKKVLVLLHVCLLGGPPAVLAAQPKLADNPYAPPPSGSVEGLINAALFGVPGADAVIEKRLLDDPGMAKSQRAALEDRLCGDYYVHSVYPLMVKACSIAEDLGTGELKSLAIGKVLINTPPIRTIGSTSVPLTKNDLGSRDVLVKIGDVSVPWLFDSGAQISVVSQSLANRLHLRMVGGDVAVGSTTGDTEGRLAVIDLMQIGDAYVENVPVLIQPDAQLKIADLAQIQGVLGLPVMVAFRRVAWSGGAQRLSLGDAAPTPPEGALKIYWDDEGVGIPVSTSQGLEGAQFDSGSNEGYLWTPAHLLLDADTEAQAVDHVGHLGGAAGVIETREKLYKEIHLEVAGVPMSFSKLTLTPRDDEGAGRFGDDVLQRLDLLDLDFEHMRLLAKPL
jgi:hypothetical protein